MKHEFWYFPAEKVCMRLGISIVNTFHRAALSPNRQPLAVRCYQQFAFAYATLKATGMAKFQAWASPASMSNIGLDHNQAPDLTVIKAQSRQQICALALNTPWHIVWH